MQWTVIKTKAQYKKALARTLEIFHATPGSKVENELDLLLVLIKEYEDQHIILADLDPPASSYPAEVFM
jgi:HTH-type transcriptional regulator / antitoxin HigA